MIASTLAILCNLCVALACQLLNSDAGARRQWWLAFAFSLPLATSVLPFGFWLADPIAQAIAPTGDTYTTIMGGDQEKKTIVFLGWMVLAISALAWPVSFGVVRVRPTPRAMLHISLALTCGHMTGWALSDFLLRWFAVGQYANTANQSEGVSEIVSSCLFQAGWFLAIWFATTVALWILIRGRRRALAFVAGLVIATLAIFPVILLPGDFLPNRWQMYVMQYAFYAYFGQHFASAVISVAGLSWVATRPDEDYPAELDASDATAAKRSRTS